MKGLTYIVEIEDVLTTLTFTTEDLDEAIKFTENNREYGDATLTVLTDGTESTLRLLEIITMEEDE